VTELGEGNSVDGHLGLIEAMLDQAGVVEHRRILSDIFATAVDLSDDGADELDLKIIRTALSEMRAAFAPVGDRIGAELVGPVLFRLALTRAGEVRVQVSHCGVCHSDLSIVDGTFPSPLPILLPACRASDVPRVAFWTAPKARHCLPDTTSV
jgi:hypothetical protein